ncbi:HAD family hydrolase [Xiamenia xianingshaonis]|uniref:HAD family phosphatase n=1 Tax=Xiamenia xianingshaonis TaxID=2682776 RepID=A0A9E6MP97_9ACTN|nr:HAD family phosphatase [Xiamenia xianingshaonis]NHM13991.1 HAD-IA family hydrolase [Xiamenia xianingshaonis]QTU83867.1 HAD family phosphatase [Xiamenia xianingshaonis]
MDKLFAVFDLDGTLVDSMGYWAEVGPEYLAGLGMTEGVDEIRPVIEAMTMEETARYMHERFLPDKTPNDIAAGMNGVMEAHYRNDIGLKPGARAHLERLRSCGVRMAVATVTARALVEALLAREGIADWFEFVLTCADVGKSKREPDIYQEAARRLGAAPAEVAVYEDALYAVRSAAQAGCFVVGVRDCDNGRTWDDIVEAADETVDFGQGTGLRLKAD